MNNTNLILFLKRFSNQEWRDFRKFVHSPYFNQREDIQRLNAYLEDAIKHLPRTALSKELVFAEVYKDEKFNEKKLRHSRSVLFRLLKKFLGQKEYEGEAVHAQQYLCSALRKKGLTNFFEKELEKTYALIEANHFRDSNYYQNKFELWVEESIVQSPQNRSDTTNFQSSADQISIAYISRILRISCNIQSLQNMASPISELKLLPGILDIVQSGEYLHIPAVAIHYHGYRALEYLEQHIEKSEMHFEALKDLIHTHWQLFPTSEIRDIYLLAINYCIKRLNAGERHFIREAFELFRSGLKNETLLEDQMLSSFTYKNITRLGIALQENDWVEQFLEDYKKVLHPSERENSWRYNLAFVYFEQQKYKSAMQLLLQVEFKDVLNNLDARRMLLKSYFELGEYNALDSLLDSFSRYIQRQKKLGYHKENYHNLIRFVKSIIHKSTLDKNVLKQQIANTKRLAEREWLLEKIENSPDWK